MVLFIIGTSIAVFLYLFPTSYWQLFLVSPILSIFNGLTQANTSAIISQSASASIQGEILGLNSSVAALAQTIPGIISGIIVVWFSPSATILVSSIIILSAFAIFRLYSNR